VNARERGTASKVFMTLGPLCAAALTIMAWKDRAYYLLPLAERPLSGLHAALRPSGSVGLFYGIAGFVLIVLNLTYLVRSTKVRWEWMGSLRAWMSMHVFTGLIGAYLIILHSAFLLRSPIAALAAVSLIIVVLSGVSGRYIYTRVPRSPQGRELELGELKKALGELQAALEAKGVELPPELHADADVTRGSVISALAAMVTAEREEHRQYERLRALVLASPTMAPSAAGILPLARRYVTERSWLSRYHELRELMRVWRFFHRWFSVVMIIFAVFHVVIATNVGPLGLSLP
jgi:hypothetical protein